MSVGDDALASPMKSGSPAGSGALFGLALAPGARGVYYVDDVANTLRLLH